MLSLVKQSLEWGSQGHLPSVFKYAGDRLFCLRNGHLFRVEAKDSIELVRVHVELKRKAARTREEELLAERLRSSSDGISELNFHAESNKFFVSGRGTIFTLDPSTADAREIPAGAAGARLHTVLSSDAKRMGFVRNRNVFLTNVETGQEVQVSNANGTTVMAGEADFIHQEEFGLFRTYHISPNSQDSVYRILYLEMDESEVAVFNIPNLNDLTGSVDPFRYALTGTKNSSIKVKLARVKANDTTGDVVESVVTLDHVLPTWTEYVTRLGWLDKVHVYIVASNRLQNHVALLRVNTETNQTAILYEEKVVDCWINACKFMLAPLHVFADGSVLIASERSGFAHLYRISVTGQVKAITSGNWQVDVVEEHTDGHMLVLVDEARNVVFFHGHRESVLEKHIYVASLAADADPANCVRLTDGGFSHKGELSLSQFVVTRSNLNSVHELLIYRIVHDHAGKLPRAELLAKPLPLVNPSSSAPFPFASPKLFSIESNGFPLHGATYFPPNFDAQKKYPLVVYTYGGPTVKLVENDYDMTRGYRSSRFQLLASLGYIVSVLDNRGSGGRGMAFQKELYLKMGTVEVEDQVKHVEYLVKHASVDSQRVAIFGSSYGGYMALMALAKYSNVFKIGYASAPVTSWEAYDTGYTERYMGLPSENVEGYRIGSVLANADGFPSESDRIVIFHGGSDENVHYCHAAMLCQRFAELEKMYTLNTYPQSRHGVHAIHSALTMLNHVQKHL